MEKAVCSHCQKSNPQLQCGCCGAAVCKYCAHILDDSSFDFLTQRPAHLSAHVFCHPCFNEKVAPELENYNQTLEQAKAVHIFDKTQGKETRLLKRRSENKVMVENCEDPDEAVLRLAFFAVQKNCNAVVDVDVSATKIKNGSYSKRIWRASGICSQLNVR